MGRRFDDDEDDYYRGGRGRRRSHYRRTGDADDDDLSDYAVWMVVIAGLVIFALGWIDSKVGWGLKDAVLGWLSGALSND